jgi:hypothetical protein
VPSAELSADGFEGSYGFEPDIAMQCDAGIIGQGDTRVRVTEAFLRQLAEQLPVQSATDPATVMFRMHIGGYFDRPAISLTRTVRRAVIVADALP